MTSLFLRSPPGLDINSLILLQDLKVEYGYDHGDVGAQAARANVIKEVYPISTSHVLYGTGNRPGRIQRVPHLRAQHGMELPRRSSMIGS